MEGIITIPSDFGPKETMDRLEEAVHAQGMIVFARIDHAAGAGQAGLSLKPNELLIFGHPSAGTPLMQANPLIGIDLPLKVLVWQDGSGKTQVSSVDAAWLGKRHNLLVVGTVRLIRALADAVDRVLYAAARPNMNSIR